MFQLLLLALAINWASSTYVSDDNLKYTCPSGTMLMVYNKEVDRVRMVCQPPKYCGVMTVCHMQTGALCTQEKEFLTQVITIPGKNSFLATCCKFEPPPNRKYKERCMTYKVVPKEMAGDPDHPKGHGKGNSVPDGMEVMSLLIEDSFGKGPEDGFPSVKGLVPTTFGWSVIYCYPSCDEETTTPPTQQPTQPNQQPPQGTVQVGSCSSQAACATKCSSAPGGGGHGPAPTKKKRSTNLLSSNCHNGVCECKFDHVNPDLSHFHPGAGGAGFCFSGDSMVRTPSGQMRMDHLNIGQQVLVMNEATGQAVYESVDSFIHRRHDIQTTFVNIKTAAGTSLSLSGEHLLPVVKCGAQETVSNVRYAKDATVGECLLVKDGDHIRESEITEIGREIKTGIYAPLTKSGTVLVDDVVASCYSKFEGYYVQNTFYRVFNLLQTLFTSVTDSSSNPVDPPNMLHLFETMESV